MKIPKNAIPIAKTDDGDTIFYKINGEFDGVFMLNDEEIKLTLADYFAKRTDITPIEDSKQTKDIWIKLRQQMGATKNK